MRQPQEQRREMGLDGERQEWGQIRDLWLHLEEVEPKDWGWWGAVPERGAHTKGTVRKGTEPKLGSSSRGQTDSGGARGITVLRWGWIGTGGTVGRLATISQPGLIPALK